MGWPRRLVLVRHAESEGNVRSVDERAQYEVATYAYKLTKRGRQQAAITGKYLRQEFNRFDVYYTSYYTRAKETMRIMYPRAKIYEDPRLAESQRGIWHTMTKDEIAKTYPGEMERKKREGLYHFRPLGGENWPDVELRIHSFMGTLSRDYDDQDVLIVIHGFWLILFQRLVEHFSINEAVRRFKNKIVENASITIYDGVVKNGHSRLVLQAENIVPWKDKL